MLQYISEQRRNDMDKLKDFFYNKNDIIVAVIILLVAAFVIYSRIGAIMNYPETISSENVKEEIKTEQSQKKS